MRHRELPCCSGKRQPQARNLDLSKRSVRSRDGHTGARPQGDIGFAALRGGSVVGDHTVIFAGNAERIDFHKAESRDIFAHGAVKAALWARGQSPASILWQMYWDWNNERNSRACAPWPK